MERTPFRTFDGFLKQHAQESLSDTEQALFELLFPAFEGTSEAEDAYQKAIDSPLASIFAPLIEFAPGDRRPRRFSGRELPRRRYYALCQDPSGNDDQTLAHELRAYRNPIDLGMVEVLDLAGGVNLQIRDVVVPLAAQRAVAVLIHEPQLLPERFRALDYRQAPGLKGSPLFIYTFPYRVTPCKIERTIDLRFPDVQAWFYRTFRVLPDAPTLSVPAGLGESPTIAHSQFHLDNGVPAVPDTFWSMLPTLMNPDLGGGNPADTGSTLLAIGHWMRQHEVAALVYPSARCDAATQVQGDLKAWRGWNLLDYRDSPLTEGPSHVFTFVLSPWAWDSLPPGVRLHVADPGSSYAGSFAVEHMVDYWAEDYVGQLKALEIARSIHGRESRAGERGVVSDGLACRAFQIGCLSVRWVRMMVEGAPAQEIESAVLELQGLALPYGLYPMTGRVLELWSAARKKPPSLNELLDAVLTTNSLVFRFLGHRYPDKGLDKLATIGADLELICFFLAMRVKAGNKVGAAALDVSGFLGETASALATTWLDDGLRREVGEFHKKALQAVNSGSGNAAQCLEDGVRLQKAIYDHVRTSAGH